MKYIVRWGLMKSAISENLSEHSLDTAFIAHALALYRNIRFGGNVDPERCAVLAMYHDVQEIITGDLPTPVKYFNPGIKAQYDAVEDIATEKLLSVLPADMREHYSSIFTHREEDRELWVLVKAADKLSALIKCIGERQMGNKDYLDAERNTMESLEKMELPEVAEFLREFIPAYNAGKTLDELIGQQ